MNGWFLEEVFFFKKSKPTLRGFCLFFEKKANEIGAAEARRVASVRRSVVSFFE
jgi:hypothetical protein